MNGLMEQLSLIPVCEKHGCEKHWTNSNHHKGGGLWQCRECMKERSRKHYLKNKSKKAAASKEWREQNLEASREIGRRWRAANPEKVRAASLAWHHANKEKAAAAFDRWRRANKAARNAYCRGYFAQRRASSKHLLDAVDESIVRAIYARAERLGLHVDHIHPIRLQGEHAPWNLQLLSQSENSSKGGRRPTLKEVMRGERRYRLLRKIFENEATVGAAA